MNWSSNEFIWLDWVVLVVGLLGKTRKPSREKTLLPTSSVRASLGM